MKRRLLNLLASLAVTLALAPCCTHDSTEHSIVAVPFNAEEMP